MFWSSEMISSSSSRSWMAKSNLNMMDALSRCHALCHCHIDFQMCVRPCQCRPLHDTSTIPAGTCTWLPLARHVLTYQLSYGPAQACLQLLVDCRDHDACLLKRTDRTYNDRDGNIRHCIVPLDPESQTFWLAWSLHSHSQLSQPMKALTPGPLTCTARSFAFSRHLLRS
jgi:hypothetical protein